MTRRLIASLAALTVAATTLVTAPPSSAQTTPVCEPGGPPVVVKGSAQPSDAKTYRLHPFDVSPGTTRVEVGYSWSDLSPLPSTPLTQSVVDLGLWDADGYRDVDGFRGWSGSRQGKTAEGQAPIFVQADSAERGYVPGPIEPGIWHAEAGIAAVGPFGLDYEITVSCSDPATGAAFVADPVDPGHVANPEPGWYAGDFHMHGRHSNPSAPEWDNATAEVDSFVDYARAAGLDFFPITEYVTTQHHAELGPVQRANPDVVVWPGREIITYFGHATVFGETPSTVEYRHGFEDVTLGQIQADTVADGALFGIAHPTVFPTALFASFCRGCEFTLESSIDWDDVTTMELVTGPLHVGSDSLGLPDLGVEIMNPFILTAILEWEGHLRAGRRITAVSGSDDKLGPDFGTAVTRVYAEELSRPALVEAVRAGRAYIQTQGVDGPTLDFTAKAPDGSTAMMGDTLFSNRATMSVTVTGAVGQLLTVNRNGLPAGAALITSDPYTHTFSATAGAGSGPLGTFYRLDTFDLGIQAFTTISNPIFLNPGGQPVPPDDDDERSGVVEPEPTESPGSAAVDTADPTGSLPATGATVALWAALGLAAAAVPLRRAVAERRRP